MIGIAYAFWDWNWTLLDDGPLWNQARCATFRHHRVEPPPLEEFFARLAQGGGDYLEVYRSYGIAATREELNEVYERVYREGIAGVRLMRGAVGTIRALRDRGVPSSIITQQGETLFTPIFTRFTTLRRLIRHVRCGIKDKAGSMVELAELEAIPISRCAYVGDAASDAAAAKRAGAIAIAYRTPEHPPADFPEAPDHTVSRLTDILALVDEKQ